MAHRRRGDLADVQRIPKTQGLPRPVIDLWSLAGVFVPMRVTVRILTQPPSTQEFTYKWATEVWLEWKRFEYEEELTRSPLLRGQPALTVPLWLRTCFEFSPEGDLNTISEPPSPIPIPNTISLIDLQQVEGVTGRPLRIDSQFAGRDAVFSWNALDTSLAAALANVENPKPIRMDDESVVKLFLRRAESLLPDSPLNQTLDEVLQWMTLPAAQVKKLRELKITDLRTLAASLRIARGTALQKISLKADRPRRAQTQEPSEIPRLPQSLLSTQDAALIMRAIGKALQTRFEKSGYAAPVSNKVPTKRQRIKRARR